MSTPIPQPPAIPFLGNVTSIESEVPPRSYLLLARQYGEIYQLDMLGRRQIVLNSYELLNEVSDEKRFKKVIAGSLNEVRRAAGDGLFTAHLEEPNWGIAHRILMPAFGPVAIAGMYNGMMDICSQLVLKWERFGPMHTFDVSEDFTRLTFDTISLCSMNHRINSFYDQGLPPFVLSMGDFLTESYKRTTRPALLGAVMRGANAKFESDAQRMLDITRSIIAERKAEGLSAHNDLLDRLLGGRDPKTGQGLSDENVMYQLITFLIAGHETTSGVLSFIVHSLLTSPDAMDKLRAEVDTVVGTRTVALADIPKLEYMTAVIREAMRLFPPLTGRSVVPLEDTTLLGGKYAVKKGDVLRINTLAAQRDSQVFGEDADEFKPERLLGDKFDKLPPNAWQPFGFGMRACIGRAFAWQEMHLVLASIIQRFDLQLADPSSYSLHVKFTLTPKPHVAVRAIPRAGAQPVLLAVPSLGLHVPGVDAGSTDAGFEGKQHLYVFYGSNTGACEAFAQKIASAAPANGFAAKLDTLDAAARRLPSDGPVVVITASYEGEPADNAAHFVSWLSGLEGAELAGVNYSIFGAGNHDWVATYQKIPKLVDEAMEQRGARRLLARAEGDAGGAEFFQAFDDYERALWDVLVKEYGTTKQEAVGLSMKLLDAGTARAAALHQSGLDLGTVLGNRVLTAAGHAEKRHIEFELPKDMSYQAGDYLAILPTNPDASVQRVLARFGISREQEIVLSAGDGPTPLPVDKPVVLASLLSGYVELAQPASVGDLRVLLKYASTDKTKQDIETLIAEHGERVMSVRLSVLDVLERHPDLDVPFPAFLQVLPAMRVRQYSISSSPLWDAKRATLTISVVRAAASLSAPTREFVGVSSNFLANLVSGDRVALTVRPSSAPFHLPSDPAVPVVMFCAGSGLAPFRGFCQERALQRAGGRATGSMLLFYGCRAPDEDYLYANAELAEWADAGVVDIRPAFSRRQDESAGCKYVQDRVLHDTAAITAAYAGGAKFYMCGSGRIAQGVKSSLVQIIRETNGFSVEEAQTWFDEKTAGRFATDLFD